MGSFPLDQKIIMSLGLLALLISGFAGQMGLAGNKGNACDVHSGSAKLEASRNKPEWPALALLTLCTCANLYNFLGLLTLLGSILVMACTQGDARYVAKKFAAYHFFALTLLICRDFYLPSSKLSEILTLAAFGIVLAIYPFNSWLDSFFLRTSHHLSSIWLIFVRPTLVLFFLKELQRLLPLNTSRGYYIVVVITLMLVPMLLFARVELRRIVACLCCWQSGYIWLFAIHLPQSKSHNIGLMAITQGVLLASIAQVIISLHKKKQVDLIANLAGLWEKDYFSAVFLMSSLSLLVVLPIAFMLKKGMPQPADLLLILVLVSEITPLLFIKKLHKVMQQPTPSETKQSAETPAADGK